jgi:hypothetical protein
LLAVRRDPLATALSTPGVVWSVNNLTRLAQKIAVETDDISLMGLAAYIGDPILLTAFRESSVLYTDFIALGYIGPKPYYLWRVEKELTVRAQRFVNEYNSLFHETPLPAPCRRNANRFWDLGTDHDIAGRCIRIGLDQKGRHYHWALGKSTWGQLTGEEFWDTRQWTNESYRKRELRTRPYPETRMQISV